MTTNTEKLIEALQLLSQSIDSVDGVANAAIFEAAQRLDEARAEAERLNDLVKTLTHRLEVSRNATQRFADELADLRAKNTHPEPSRLEIAAMLMANDRNYDGPTMALKRADALIAAAKEAK